MGGLASRGRWPGRPIAAMLFVALLAAAGTAGCGSGDDGGGKKSSADAQTINFQKPDDPGPDPFTEPADVESGEEVPLPASGPYGGSGSDKVCDRDRLIRYLKSNPDKLREWARVLGVEPTQRAVSKYIAKLHPVTLTRDTQVTNHSFVDGRAVPFQAILQAGTAVLVDDYGRPVARCRCGNPLKKPVVVPSATCKGCPPNYEPPRQCKLYTRRVNYRRTTYTSDYYGNQEYDEIFIEASRSGPYENCYAAHPAPPVVTIVEVYKQPPPETTPTPPTETEPDCENPRSQEEFELCNPQQEEPEPEPAPEPPSDYDCPDQPPAHPGEDYLENCPG